MKNGVVEEMNNAVSTFPFLLLSNISIHLTLHIMVEIYYYTLFSFCFTFSKAQNVMKGED